MINNNKWLLNIYNNNQLTLNLTLVVIVERYLSLSMSTFKSEHLHAFSLCSKVVKYIYEGSQIIDVKCWT